MARFAQFLSSKPYSEVLELCLIEIVMAGFARYPLTSSVMLLLLFVCFSLGLSQPESEFRVKNNFLKIFRKPFVNLPCLERLTLFLVSWEFSSL